MIRALIIAAIVAACGDPMILLVGPPPDAEPPPANKMVVGIGHSNMIGLSIAANVVVYPGVADPDPAVQWYDKTAGSSADPPTFVIESGDMRPRSNSIGLIYTPGMGGIELTMMRELAAATPNTWSVAKLGLSGSSLFVNWNASGYPTGGPRMRDQLITFITDRAAAFGVTDLANNLTLAVALGANDASHTSAEYLAEFDDFIGALRTALGNFTLVLERLRAPGNLAREIASAQESFVSGDAKAGIYYTDDIALRGDGIHFSDDGYATLGVRAKAALDAPIGPQWKAASTPKYTATVTPQTPVIPRHQAGDILVVALSGVGNANYPLSDAQGFVEVAGSPQHDGGDATNPRLHLWWKRAASDSDTPPTIGDSGTGLDIFKLATAFVIRGAVASGNPFEDTHGATAASSTAISTPTVVTSGPDRLVLTIIALNRNAVTTQCDGWANADLIDVTEHMDRSVNATFDGLAIVAGRKAAAGAVGATTATIAGAAPQAMVTLAVKP